MRHRLAIVSVWLAAAVTGLALSTRTATSSHHRYTPVPSVKSFIAPPHLDAAPPIDASAPAERTAPRPEPGTAAEAVTRYLAAEVAGDDVASWALVSSAGTDRYPTIESWRAGRDRLQPTSFAVQAAVARSATTSEITVAVTYSPAIDPFTGFVPGRAIDTFVARQQDGHWRVDPSPSRVDPQLPPDEAAVQVAQSWLDRLSACDSERARQLQTASPLYGPLDSLTAPCRMHATWIAEPAQPIASAFDAPDYVAAFGSGVTSWARVVTGRTPDGQLSVVVAPLGDDWKVLGVLNKPIGGGRG